MLQADDDINWLYLRKPFPGIRVVVPVVPCPGISDVAETLVITNQQLCRLSFLSIGWLCSKKTLPGVCVVVPVVPCPGI